MRCARNDLNNKFNDWFIVALNDFGRHAHRTQWPSINYKPNNNHTPINIAYSEFYFRPIKMISKYRLSNRAAFTCDSRTFRMCYTSSERREKKTLFIWSSESEQTSAEKTISTEMTDQVINGTCQHDVPTRIAYSLLTEKISNDRTANHRRKKKKQLVINVRNDVNIKSLKNECAEIEWIESNENGDVKTRKSSICQRLFEYTSESIVFGIRSLPARQ